MLRLVIITLLIVGLLLGGYYLFNITIRPKSSSQTNNTKITPQLEETKGNLEQKKKGRDIPQGQEPFFGKVIDIKDSTITLQSNGATKNLTIKFDNETAFVGDKQSDIAKNVNVAGIGKTNADGSITAVKLEVKSN